MKDVTLLLDGRTQEMVVTTFHITESVQQQRG
jgi:hypothetical protein